MTTKPRRKSTITASLPSQEDRTLCGLGGWHPQWLQRFATPMVLVINLSLVAIVQSMTGTMFYSTMNTLEKRYHFDSKVSSVIMIADNVSQMVLSPLAGYFAIRFNRARLIGSGELILAASCFITASPYFIYGPNDFTKWTTPMHANGSSSLVSSLVRGDSNAELCSAKEAECLDSSNDHFHGATVWPAVALLFCGSFFRGIGLTLYYVIGFPYIDDNVEKKKSPLYLCYMFAIRLVGPASGFILSGFCLKLYENPMHDPGFSLNDPRFIGAWWLGFCCVGILLALVSLPMFLFPFEFPQASVKAGELLEGSKPEERTFRASLKRFLTNRVVLLMLFGGIFRMIGIGGYVMFNSKYTESQYRTSSASSSLLAGTVGVLPMTVGIVGGGLFVALRKPSVRLLLIFVFLMESTTIGTFLMAMVLGCQPIRLVNGGLVDGSPLLSTPCNLDCHCSTRQFTPTCSPNGLDTYFSPCHAGCTIGVNQTYSNCSCFTSNITNTLASLASSSLLPTGSGGPIRTGYCQADQDGCTNLIAYSATIIVGFVLSSTAMIPNTLITFRSMDPLDKSFTMGVSGVLMAIFAFIPYPLIFGALVDSTCLVWQRSKCGNKRGNCWIYDQEKFRFRLHGAALVFTVVGSLLDLVTIFFADDVKSFYEDEEENVKKEEDEQDSVKKLEEAERRGPDGVERSIQMHEVKNSV